MLLLVHASPTTLEPYRCPQLGVLSSPRRFYPDAAGWPWAADNDAYSDWDEGRYRRMLGKIAEIPGGLFVTAPDVVGDADATLALFDTWALEVRQAVAPVALVAQDGLTPERVPWGMIGALFIGGTTAWKMGGEAYDLVREAKRRGLWVHMGRVNSNRRLVYAKAIGCDSVDGSSASWYRDTKLPARLTWAARPPQLLLGRPPGVELSGSS